MSESETEDFKRVEHERFIEISMALACVCWLAERSADLAGQMREEILRESGIEAWEWNQVAENLDAYQERHHSPGRPRDFSAWKIVQ